MLNKRTTHRVNERERSGVVTGRHRQLSAEQVLAYQHVTRSRDLAVVVGIAGGGKSTMLGTARQVWEGQGYRVRGAALSGIAAEGLEGSAGIESRTIASWELAWDQDKDPLTARDVLVVDEAGMIGSRSLGRLVDRVHRAGAKLVLVGDAEQLQAIEAGAAFRAIAERVGVIAITEPRRQQVEWQRLATKELASARTEAALDRYERAGLVERHATRDAARAGVISAWQAARAQHPEQSQLILAHERVDVRALNMAARAVRRAAGELGDDQLLQTEAGAQVFAEGDRIYFLRNERSLGGSGGTGVKNGTLGTVTRIEGEHLTVVLDGKTGTGQTVTFNLSDYADIGHGYAATIHKNQGATVDQAHVLATPGMDRHLAYVAMSRHRHAAQLHWSAEDFGSAVGLRDRLGRERAKDTTLDYADPDPIAAYAERRGLDPLAPASEIVVSEAVRPRPTVRDRLLRARLAPVLQSALSALQTAIEQQVATIGRIAATLGAPDKPDGEPPLPDGYNEAAIRILDDIPPPPRRPGHFIVQTDPEHPEPPLPVDPFEDLRLGAGPASSQAFPPGTFPLTDAVIAFVLASRDGQKMVAAGLPLLAHQEAALRTAQDKIEGLRPGFVNDLVVASRRQPMLVAQAEQSAQGVALLITAAEGVRDAREEAARRHAEDEALAPVRERVFKERMEAWWRQNHPHNPPHDRSRALLALARPAEEALKREIEAMPAAELRRMEADWAQADRAGKPVMAPHPSPRRSGPSPF